ncbi:MAG: hypothetical protein OXS28_06130 [Gammaproteobacteria bacterium]|nr:hypothetical protein [Gammaproteobacteria bacterium]
MLLSINTKTLFAERQRTERLNTFGIDERALQDILFRSLDRLFPDDELILLMQSQYWQEEPDLMAVDKEGKLYIFELKIWESRPSNLLQVLRYGQIFGNAKYSDLNALYEKSITKTQSLKESHDVKFGVNLAAEHFNQRQVFVVITNGLDYKTREAIQYWRSCGLDVRPWVYRVYRGKNEDEFLLEISTFRVQDNPYEDLAEGYYILNTNFGNSARDHEDMLHNGKASAYFTHKFKIERLAKGDTVFLYKSRTGIVAFGKADGNLQMAPYHGQAEYEGEEYFMKLQQFQTVSPSLSASEIKDITGIPYSFMHTLFGLDADSGRGIEQHIHNNPQV